VRITAGWDLSRVQPLFGTTSACVLFGRRERAGRRPAEVEQFSGTLPRRDATEASADAALRRTREPWPPTTTLEGASPYRARFKQGATIVPRRFFVVEREPEGRLGGNPAAPRVRGRISAIDKPPWKSIDPPHGAIEAEFLRPVLLGESIAPFRLLIQALAVVPARGHELLVASAAVNAGYRHLAAWLRDAEAKWVAHCSKRADGTPRMTLHQRLDHMRGLSAQLSATGMKVVYTKAGTLLSAAVLDDPRVVVDHMAYWTTARTIEEARYLTAIINSTTVLARVIPMQPRGSVGPRHFDNLVWELRIPDFDRREALHRELADAAAKADQVATVVPLSEGAHFTRQRRAIREALVEDGIAATIDALVARLLDR
jgi:hypothetical protein